MANFQVSDDIIKSLVGIVPNLADPLLESKYAGFAAVSVVAIFEVNIKGAIQDFCRRKHRVFGVYAENRFGRINGRIKLNNLRDDYIGMFGERYGRRWTRNLNNAEQDFFKLNHRSMRTSYTNLMTWRHEFAHSGQFPTFATFGDVVQAYEDAKGVVTCFEQTLVR